MFTGIVEEIGTVVALDRSPAGGGGDHARLTVSCRDVLSDATTGASVAVSGCCLTVRDLSPPGDVGGDAAGTFTADLMRETLRTTTLGDLTAGGRVNLERPLAADGRFGGHVVQGHVDGVGQVVGREEDPGAVVLTVRTPPELGRHLVAKGSVAVDGVSLTVVDTDDERAAFRVGLVPHTRDVTTLGTLAVGDRVNLEVDVLAKYVERALASGSETPYG